LSTQALSGVRHLGWVAVGLILSLMAEQTVVFAMPLIIFERTQSVSTAGFAFALEWVPPIIAYPFAGLLADRMGGHRLFKLANLARGSCLGLALICCLFWPDWTVQILIGTTLLMSVLMTPNRMASQKTIAMIGPDSELAHRLSMLQNIELISMASGPGIAAVLALWIGKLALFGVAACAFLLAIPCWHAVRVASTPKPAETRVLADLMLGWRLLFANRAVILLAAINFSINLVFAVVLSANAYMITGVFKAPEFILGLMSAGAGALGLVNLMLVPRILKRWTIYHLGAGGFLLVCGNLIALGLAGNVWLYAGCFLMAMIGATLFNVFNRTERILAIGKEHLGKVSGAFFVLNAFSYPLGGAITAAAGARYGVQSIVLVLAVALALTGIPLLVTSIHHFSRRQRAVA
jgi:MFS family permease